MQAAYDAITKGETQQQAGGYGYGQQGYSNPYGNYQQQGSYQQNGYYSSQNNGYTDFGGFDFDPVRFRVQLWRLPAAERCPATTAPTAPRCRPPATSS